MNKLTLLSVTAALLLSACGATNPTNKLTVGDIERSTLLAEHATFQRGTQTFNLSAEEKSQIALWPKDLSISIYFGTWCHDSQREVPRMLIIAEQANIELKLIALDYQKSEPLGRAKSANVKYTPTIIVTRSGKELGRIIERPKKSLISDISSFI